MCTRSSVANIVLDPATATNELEQGVTATVAAGPDGVPGVTVTFDVTAGPNAAQAGSDVTDGNGEATFTYPAAQGLAGLGTDTIEACFTDDLGITACTTATKEWVDTTHLTATDAVDPDPELFVRDTGSGTAFGPFASGTVVKYTQASGATPNQKKIGGPNSKVDWHLTGNGDAETFAVDASGNESDGVACLVPEPPK